MNCFLDAHRMGIPKRLESRTVHATSIKHFAIGIGLLKFKMSLVYRYAVLRCLEKQLTFWHDVKAGLLSSTAGSAYSHMDVSARG